MPLSNLNITVHQNPEASNKFMVYIFDEQQNLEVEIMRKIIEQVYSTASGFKLGNCCSNCAYNNIVY